MRYILLILLTSLLTMMSCSEKSTSTMATKPVTKMKALILDGENNHGVWPKTTVMIKDYLEQTGMFDVEVARKAFIWQGPHSDEVLGADGRNALLKQYAIPGVTHKEKMEEGTKMDPDYSPNFAAYDLIVSNLGWKSSDWPEATKQSFVRYMKSGGGLVVFHAADNAFGDWPEFNKMIGLGGWGDRSEKTGPYVFFDDNGNEIRDPSVGSCGSHGPGHEFAITTRAPDHPIMKGVPAEWLHTKDELYDRLRGPAENMTVLATAYSDTERNAPPWDKSTKGTGRHEPMLMAIDYHDGRVFHTALGHNDYSIECVGFMTTLQRGAEWAATGKVTLPIPADFPAKGKTSMRAWTK